MGTTAAVAGSTRTVLRILLLCLLAPAALAFAQESPPKPSFTLPKDNPLSAWNKHVYGHLKIVLLRSADKMSEENYNFKPTDAVRSYGQIVGHLADSQYLFCSMALGEKSPAAKIEQTKTSKADLIASLKEAFAYCDKAYAGMTDAAASQAVVFMGGETPRPGVLIINNMHAMEHYGNLVTYMRLKNVVPPTSEPGFLPPAGK